ncbi:phage holin [Bacillus sp. REN3]|uniref:phage holin n=1 Tax=Bacillus sp. REN3 TaxID=2802440 RepID=UPI001AEDCBBA|nr:phage holin [Bacillus sp. REN3]
MVNWSVRLKNKTWVLAFLSQVMIVAQIILEGLNAIGLTSYQLTAQIQNDVLLFANGVFVVLSMLGIIQDPTTKGLGDSDRALRYKEPV